MSGGHVFIWGGLGLCALAVYLGWRTRSFLDSADTAHGRLVEPFTGAWRNVDPKTGSITREVKVRMWGRCRPADCDWGTPRAGSGRMDVTWNPSSGRRDYTSSDFLLPE